MNYYSGETYERPVAAPIDMPAVMRQVYMWMFLGLVTTGVISYFIGMNEALVYRIFRNPWALLVLVVAQLGLVFFIMARINRLNPGAAVALFLAYAATMGVMLSSIFIVYNLGTIAFAFFASAAMFGVTSLFAMTTKMDLSKMGNLLFVALIGLLIASVVNIFFASSALYWIINYAGVLIFVALTAYDTQRIKTMAQNIEMTGTFNGVQGNENGEMVMTNVDQSVAVQRLAIIGALKLYLDFINLFMFMLRIVGGGRR